MRAILPRPETLLIAMAFRAVFVNVGHGQNGFLTAALLGGALHWLDRRPWLAGVLIGCLAYKPQFGVLIPIALLAGGRWGTIGAAMVTVAALVAVSFVTLGGSVWHAFADSMNFTQTVVLEQGGTGWEKNPVDIFGGADVGRERSLGLRLTDRAGAVARRQSRLAVAERCRLRTQGLGAGDRQPARDALRSRLRSRRARSRHRVLRTSRIEPRLPQFRDQPAGGGVDRAADIARRPAPPAYPLAC
jgi:Glycosyltransferase family 87